MAKEEDGFKLDSKKVMIISVILILISSGSISLYYNNELKKMNNNFNTQLLELTKIIKSDLMKLENSLSGDISSLQDNLTVEMQIIDNSLDNFKKKNDVEINTLNSLIDEIEKQSEIKLGELKDELKSIKVKSKDFTAIIEDVIQSVVSVGTNKGLGSGVVIDDRGFIVTNYHVVNGASIIRILTYDDEIYDAALIGFNDVVDIAVLKVDASLENLRLEKITIKGIYTSAATLGVGLTVMVYSAMGYGIGKTVEKGYDSGRKRLSK